PRRATPDARSVIALAFPHPASNSPSPSEGPLGRIAAYALGRDYHDVLLDRMQPLVAMLRERGHVAKTYVDHGWMLDRAAAARAGGAGQPALRLLLDHRAPRRDPARHSATDRRLDLRLRPLPGDLPGQRQARHTGHAGAGIVRSDDRGATPFGRVARPRRRRLP